MLTMIPLGEYEVYRTVVATRLVDSFCLITRATSLTRTGGNQVGVIV